MTLGGGVVTARPVVGMYIDDDLPGAPTTTAAAAGCGGTDGSVDLGVPYVAAGTDCSSSCCCCCGVIEKPSSAPVTKDISESEVAGGLVMEVVLSTSCVDDRWRFRSARRSLARRF